MPMVRTFTIHDRRVQDEPWRVTAMTAFVSIFIGSPEDHEVFVDRREMGGSYLPFRT